MSRELCAGGLFSRLGPELAVSGALLSALSPLSRSDVPTERMKAHPASVGIKITNSFSLEKYQVGRINRSESWCLLRVAAPRLARPAAPRSALHWSRWARPPSALPRALTPP